MRTVQPGSSSASWVVPTAGKEAGRRLEPVRLGYVGEAPGAFWEQAVAQVGRRFDLAGMERASLGTDGEAQYVNGASAFRGGGARGFIDPFHVFRAVGSCAPRTPGAALVDVLRGGGAEACADMIDDMVEGGLAREFAGDVASYLRRHAAEIGGGPSMGTMEAEQQHLYKSRMGSFPCAWSREGADAMARVRSWLASGFELPRRGREGSCSPARTTRREARLATCVSARPGSRVACEGRGWEYPVSGSVSSLGREVWFRADLDGV